MGNLLSNFGYIFIASFLLIIWIYTSNSPPTGTQNTLSLYNIVKDVFSGTFILITSIIALRGLNTWKNEQILKAKREICINLLTELGIIVNEINTIRQSDTIYSQEVINAINAMKLDSVNDLPKNNQYAIVLTKRWNDLTSYFQIITKSKIQAKIIMGDEIDIENLFKSFENTVSKIGNAFQKIVTVFSSDIELPIKMKEYDSYQEIIYSSWNIERNGTDLIKKELEDSYRKINDKLNPFVKLAKEKSDIDSK